MNRSYLFNLPVLGLNTLCIGGSVCLLCLGINLFRSSNIAVKVADTQILTSTSTDKLEKLTDKLEEYANIIEEKERAYQELEAVYQQSLKGKNGYGKLQQAIEKIEVIPDIDSIEEIQAELSLTEEKLREVVDKNVK